MTYNNGNFYVYTILENTHARTVFYNIEEQNNYI